MISMKGIYCYRDLKNGGKIVYIGKDSNINKNRRHKDHTGKWAYNYQQINRVIQNNPSKYKYEVLKKGEFNQNLLNALEILYIRRYKPQFNFTIGGDGVSGKAHPSFKHYATVVSDGKNIFSLRYDGKKICSNKNKEFLKQLAEKLTKKIINIKEAKKLNRDDYKRRCSELRKNKPHSKKWADNQSNSRNKTGFFRVSKKKDKQRIKGYSFAYRIPNQNKYITSNDIFKLKQKIIANNLEWKIIDIDKAINTIKGECKFDI